MLVEFYLLFQVIVIILFLIAFFTHQEILWGLSIISAGMLMLSAYNVEQFVYAFNATTSIYYPMTISSNYPYLFGINMMLFSLGILLLLYDVYDKYGLGIGRKT